MFCACQIPQQVLALPYYCTKLNRARFPKGSLEVNRGNRRKEITIPSNSKHLAILFWKKLKPYVY